MPVHGPTSWRNKVHLKDEDPWSIALPVEAKTALDPLFWTATGLQALAAGATIAAALPVWATSALLTGIPFGAIALRQRSHARQLEALVRQTYYFDRRYEVYTNRTELGRSHVDGFFSGTFINERRFTALKPIRDFTWNVDRRGDADIPFSLEQPELTSLEVQRSGVGTSHYLGLHRQNTSLAFRIEFEPMLSVGEVVDISFELFVPAYLPSTVEDVHKRPRPQVPSPGDSEFRAVDILHPIDLFKMSLVIPQHFGTTKHGLQVKTGQNVFAEEERFTRENSLFNTKLIGGEDPRWHLSLERRNPPIRASYRIYFTPPSDKLYV